MPRAGMDAIAPLLSTPDRRIVLTARRRMKNSHCGWAVREPNRLTDGRAVPVRTGSAKPPHNIDAEGA